MAQLQLIVTLIEAKELVPSDIGSANDPIVSLKVTNQPTKKSREIPNSVTPQWNEEFTFTVLEESSDELFIQVSDKDNVGAENLGKLNIPIRSLSAQPVTKWYPLLGVPSGQIRLSLLLRGEAKEEGIAPRRKVLILSLDGGGVRGAVTAQFLKLLEEKLGKPLYDVFDLFVGTSVGSMAAAALATNHSASKLLEMYEDANLHKIFPQKFIDWGLTRPKYDGKGKKEFLDQFFKNTKLKDTQKELVITSYNLRTRKFNVFSSSNDFENVLVAEACDASSAAPVYFPPSMVTSITQHEKTSDWYIDGGVTNNNPIVTAFSYAKRNFGEQVECFVLSVGTGGNLREIDGEKAKSWGAVEWMLNGLMNIAMDESLAEYQAKLLIDNNRFVRVNSALMEASDDMDDISEENVQKLKELGALWFELFGQDAIELINAYLNFNV